MEIKVYKLSKFDPTNGETINSTLFDEIRSLNAEKVHLILEWDEDFEKKSIEYKVYAVSAAIHAAIDYMYHDVSIMDASRNVYSLGINLCRRFE